ncbi:MAG: peptidylprolyl isomerase [Pontiella sp.]|nr:peptidylprolyl isomerase [Pontiella sp.]
MFDIFTKKTCLLVLPAAALIALTGCQEDEAAKAPAPEAIDLTQTEDLFSQPIKPNPLTTDPEAVIVRVNGAEITRGEIMTLMNVAMQQLGGRVPPEQIQQIQGQMYERVKNDLITKKLLDAAVAAANIVVGEEQVAETLESIKARIPEGETLEAALAAQNTTLEELTSNIRKDMATRELLESKTAGIAEATEAEAKEYYDANPNSFERPESVSASHILVKFDPDDTAEIKAEKKADIEKIRTDIIADTVAFEDAAGEHSDCPSSAQGGSLGTFGKGQMVPEFEVAAFTQDIGEIGDVIETQFGYHIVKVSDRTSEGMVDFDEAKEQIVAFLDNQKKQEAVGNYIKSLRDSATIEEM